MFTFKNVGNSSVEVIIQKPFTEEDINRAFSYVDALVEGLNIKVFFNVRSELKDNLVEMLNKPYAPLFSYEIVANTD